MNEQTVPSLLARLLERLSSQEDLELEFKLASGGLPRSLWETVSAFANTSGGYAILGIGHDEQTGSLTIQGVNNPHSMLQDINNTLRNPQKISTLVCGADDTSIEPLGNKQVIVLRVPAAPRKSRPIYVNRNPYDGTYVRRNSGDYLCTKLEVDRMMREASDIAADSTVLKNYSMDDLDSGFASSALLTKRVQEYRK